MSKRILAALCAAILALSLLAGCGAKKTQEEEPAAPVQTQEGAPAAEDELKTDQVASAGEMTEVEEVVEEGMVPVAASELKDGTYDVVMMSSSSMFKADHVQIVVENGRMQAVLFMTSKAYLYLFPGTGEEAAKADPASFIPLVELDEEMGTFTLPVEALDAPVACAAFSKKKEKWYDRTLLFRADSLPDEAFVESRITQLSDLGLEDGVYTAEVMLGGGSGRASVESPAKLTVSGGICTATIIWSSSHYDFMIVNGEEYRTVNTEGNSTFEIPVTGFDYRMPVQADTTAMSQPYLIDYTLTFDSASIRPAS